MGTARTMAGGNLTIKVDPLYHPVHRRTVPAAKFVVLKSLKIYPLNGQNLPIIRFKFTR